MSVELILGIIGTAGALATGYLAGRSYFRNKILDLEKLSSNIDIELKDIAFTPLDNIDLLTKYKRNNLFYGKIIFTNRGSVKSRIRGWNITITKPTESFVMSDDSYISNFKDLDKQNQLGSIFLNSYLKRLTSENILLQIIAIYEIQDYLYDILKEIRGENEREGKEAGGKEETEVTLNTLFINKLNEIKIQLQENTLTIYQKLFKNYYDQINKEFIDKFQKDLEMYLDEGKYFYTISPNSAENNILLIPYDNSGLVNLNIEISSASIHKKPDKIKMKDIIDKFKILKDDVPLIINSYGKVLSESAPDNLTQSFQVTDFSKIDFSNGINIQKIAEKIAENLLYRLKIHPDSLGNILLNERDQQYFNQFWNIIVDSLSIAREDSIQKYTGLYAEVSDADLKKEISSPLSEFLKSSNEIDKKIKNLYEKEKDAFYFTKKTTFSLFFKNLSKEFDLGNEDYAQKLGQEFASGHLELAQFDKIYQSFNKPVVQNYSRFFFNALLDQFKDLDPHIQDKITEYLRDYAVWDVDVAGRIFTKYSEMSPSQQEKYLKIIDTQISNIRSQRDMLEAILKNYPPVNQYESYKPVMTKIRDAVKKFSIEEDFVEPITRNKADALNPEDIKFLITQFWNHQRQHIRWKIFNFILGNYDLLSGDYGETLVTMIAKEGSTFNLKDIGYSLMDGHFDNTIDDRLKEQLLAQIYNNIKSQKNTNYRSSFLNKYIKWCAKRGKVPL